MITQERRIAVTRSHIDAALKICEQTRVELLYEIEELLRTSAVIAEPNYGCVGVRDNLLDLCWYDESTAIKDCIAPLRFYAFYPEDIEDARQEIWDRVHEAHATYKEASHAITFHNSDHMQSEPRFMQGCLVLHEAAHALFAVQEGRLYNEECTQTPDELLAEELKNYEMEMCLWRERNPAVFQSLLDETVAWVDWEHHFAHSTCYYYPGELLTRFPVLSNSSRELLARLLGPLLIDASEKRQIGMLRLFAQFEHIDRSDVLNKLDLKIDLLRLLHQGIPGYQ